MTPNAGGCSTRMLVLTCCDPAHLWQGTGMPDETENDPISVLDAASDDVQNSPKNGVTQCPGLTWFRMRLTDEDDEPMAGEDYVVVDSAGAKREGKLDENGEFFIPPSLPGGECTINFPNIHLNPRKKNQ